MYEHKPEGDVAIENIDNIIGMLVDQKPDQEQMAEYFIAASGAVSSLAGPIAEEQKPAYDAKVIVYVSLGVAMRRVDMLGLPPKATASIKEALKFSWKLTQINLPDIES